MLRVHKIRLDPNQAQAVYFAKACGVALAVVDRWYPSSKTCSCCGTVNEALTLSDRYWVCTACGVTHDRDENAARNILQEGIRTMAPGAGVSVCGEGSAGCSSIATKLPSVKQIVKA